MTEYHIAVLEGDGIGPEITTCAVQVLQKITSSKQWHLHTADFGAAAYFKHGHPFPDTTQKICDQADAILKAPIGLSYDEVQKIPTEYQPERAALLPLRQRYQTYANIRPLYLTPELSHFSPLKPAVIGEGVDIQIVRELIGGIYFGAKKRGVDDNGNRYAHDLLSYNEEQIRNIAKVAFDMAKKRKGHLHSIHKSNVLQSSVLWNEVIDEVAQQYPEVTVTHMLVDAAATHLCLNPRQFDVMVMENMFGDILSDLGGGLLGSLGLMPSACIGKHKCYYEPSHGSAPDIADKGIANPYSMIGAVAMMLVHSFHMYNEAAAIWQALTDVFKANYVTEDLAKHSDKEHLTVVGSAEFTAQVLARL